MYAGLIPCIFSIALNESFKAVYKTVFLYSRVNKRRVNNVKCIMNWSAQIVLVAVARAAGDP